MDIFGEILWLRVPNNGQECEKISGRCYARTSKNFSKYGQYIYQIAGNLVLSTNLVLKNDDLTWFEEVIDLEFRWTLSNVVIFGWPVSNDHFPTFDGEKFDIPYFEVK